MNSWKATVFEISGAVFWWNIRDIARVGKYFGIFIHPKTFPGKGRRGEFIAGIFTNSQRTVGGGIECRTFPSFSRAGCHPYFFPEKPFFCGDSNTSDTSFPLSRRDTPRRWAVNILTDDVCGKSERGTYFFAHLFALSSFTMLLPLTGADI